MKFNKFIYSTLTLVMLVGNMTFAGGNSLMGVNKMQTVADVNYMTLETKQFKAINSKAIKSESDLVQQSRLKEKERDLQLKLKKDETLSEFREEMASAGGEENQGYTVEPEEVEITVQETLDNGETVEVKKVVQKGFSVEQVEGNENAIIPISKPDRRYTPYRVELPDDQRDLLERLVTGEAGATYEGSLLVAQCIRDAIVCDGYTSIEQVRTALRYSGSIKRGKTDNAIRAVHAIFDEGKCAVQHRLYYFYAPALCISRWHETQYFVLSKDGHRYFDRITDINSHKMLNGDGGMIVLQSDKTVNSGDMVEIPETNSELVGEETSNSNKPNTESEVYQKDNEEVTKTGEITEVDTESNEKSAIMMYDDIEYIDNEPAIVDETDNTTGNITESLTGGADDITEELAVIDDNDTNEPVLE